MIVLNFVRWSVSFMVVTALLAACGGFGTSPKDGIAVRVEPSTVTLEPNEVASFTATVTRGQNDAVDWTATGGSIVGSGATITYTAPDAAGDYNIVATSQEDPTKSDTAVAEVLNGFDDVSPIGYDGETAAEGTSDGTGRLVIESAGSGARYEIALRTPSGQPAPNVAVTYTENARGRSEFVFTDPEGRFMPYLLTGTPEEVVEHLDGTIAEVSGTGDLRPNFVLTAVGISVTLIERTIAFRENQVAHQELRGFVETGDDLCPEADGYCRCASASEISMFQRAAIESEGYWIDTGVTAVTWAVGQGIPSEKVGTVVEVAGIGADAATILNEFTAAGHASAIVEAAGTTPVYAGLSAEEKLLVRLLAFDGGGRKPTWRAVQIINRGCETGLVSNPGTLDVTYDPFPPDTGQDLVINVDVADPVEEGLEVFLSMQSTGGYPAFERWVSATTNHSGRAEFKVPPHVLSSIPNLEDNIEIVVPKRDLVMGEPSTISWDVGNTQDPSPTIWSLTPSVNRAPVGDEVRFRYLVNQRTTISDEAFDLSCSIDFGDGTVRDDAPCIGTNTYQYIPWTSVRHTYEQPGLYIAKLTVTNGDGKTDTVHAPITITDPYNEPPVLEAFAVSDLEVGLNHDVAITWRTSDPEDDQLSCSLGFGDGSASEIIDPCNGSFERFKDYDAYGGYPITLRVLDRSGGLAGEFAFVQVTDQSTSPTMYPLTVSVDGGGAVTSSPAGINCPGTCIADFDEGTSVTLAATPARGWSFEGWSADTDCGGGIVAMAAARSCTATFVESGVPPGVTFTTIQAGMHHSLALDQGGNGWGWGFDGQGQLGDGGTDTDMNTPVQVAMPSGVTFTSIAAGTYHNLALDQGGNAWAWGHDGNGRLGDGGPDTNSNIDTPVQVAMPSGVTFTSVAAGVAHSLALDQDGNAWSWGSDSYGQLGDSGTNTDINAPVQVAMPSGVAFTAIAAGGGGSLALDQDGNAWAWGYDGDGGLGDGGTDTNMDTPVQVAMPSGVTLTAIAHSLALDQNGNAWAWGSDSYGQLGDGGTDTNMDTPVQVAMPSGVTFTSVAAGGLHRLAVDQEGNAWAWGYDGSGQLGDGGTDTNMDTPVQVAMPSGVTFTSIAGGGSHSLAIDQEGNGWAWGYDRFGRLGDGGASTDTNTPVQVAMP